MDIIESILVLSKAGFSAGDIKAMLSLRNQTPAQPVQPVQQIPTPAQPVQQMPTPAQPVQQMPTPAQPVQPVQQIPTPAQPVQPVQQIPTTAQPVQQMPTPAQQNSGLDSQLIGNLMNSIAGLQNAIQAHAIFYTQQPQMMSGAQMADDALASIVLPSNNS